MFRHVCNNNSHYFYVSTKCKKISFHSRGLDTNAQRFFLYRIFTFDVGRTYAIAVIFERIERTCWLLQSVSNCVTYRAKCCVKCGLRVDYALFIDIILHEYSRVSLLLLLYLVTISSSYRHILCA